MSDPMPSAGGSELVHQSQPTSLTLLAKLRDKQPNAYDRLLCLYGPLIRYWCNRRGVRFQEVEDILQDVYRVVVDRLDAFRRDGPGDSFRGWLRGITRNTILAHFRQQEEACAEGGTDAGRRFQEIPDARVATDDEEDPEDQQRGLLHRTLELIQSEFTQRDWEVFRLTVVEGINASEAAEQLNMTPAAVRKAKSRILKRVNQELGDG